MAYDSGLIYTILYWMVSGFALIVVSWLLPGFRIRSYGRSGGRTPIHQKETGITII